MRPCDFCPGLGCARLPSSPRPSPLGPHLSLQFWASLCIARSESAISPAERWNPSACLLLWRPLSSVRIPSRLSGAAPLVGSVARTRPQPQPRRPRAIRNVLDSALPQGAAIRQDFLRSEGASGCAYRVEQRTAVAGVTQPQRNRRCRPPRRQMRTRTAPRIALQPVHRALVRQRLRRRRTVRASGGSWMALRAQASRQRADPCRRTRYVLSKGASLPNAKLGSLRLPRPRTRQEFVDARPVSLFPVGDDGEPVHLGGRKAALHGAELRSPAEGGDSADEISPQDRHYLNRILVKSVPSRSSESLARRRDPGD